MCLKTSDINSEELNKKLNEKLTPIPLYEKVRERLITQIDEGVWRAGAALPNEFKLADALGVSQGTVRKALIELEKSGIVQRVQGKGTFVTTNTPERALFHFFRLAKPNGERVIPSTRILSMEVRKPLEKEAKALGFTDENQHIIQIKRLRSIDSIPTLIENIVIPQHMFEGIDKRTDLPDALYPFYQEVYHQSVLNADESIKAIAADGQQAELLDLDQGASLLSVERIAKDLRGRAIEFRLSLFATKEHSYNISLQ